MVKLSDVNVKLRHMKLIKVDDKIEKLVEEMLAYYSYLDNQ